MEGVRLPASSFTEDVDDAAEALSAFLPVALETSFDGVGISGDDSGDDVLMLLHGGVEVGDDGAGVEAPVSFGLRLDGVVEGEEAGAGSGGDDEAVEAAVEVEDFAGVASSSIGDAEEAVVDGGEFFGEGDALGLGHLSGAATGDSFDAADDEIELAGVFLGERGDDHAGFADLALLEDVAFALQPVDGAPDGSAAHVEAFGQISLDDPGAGRHFAVHDELANLLKGGEQAGSVFCLVSLVPRCGGACATFQLALLGWAGFRLLFQCFPPQSL